MLVRLSRAVDFTAPAWAARGRLMLIIGARQLPSSCDADPTDGIERCPRYRKSIATYALAIGFAIAVLLHLVGFVLGVAALVRKGDSKLRGVLGLVLNSTAVFVVVGL